jgi:peptidoglycan/LPS O-acetylase OafA/YrhL
VIPRKGHIPTLDGLRAIAVLLVLWQHLPYGVTHWRLDALRGLIGPGSLGVDIFFVLSGFLITRILLADKQSGAPLWHFLARRALRIFPIYYLTLGVVYLVSRRPDVIWSATYLSNFHQSFNFDPGPLRTTWSLAVEEHFYLFWPLVVYRMSVRNSRRIAMGVLIPGAILCSVAAIQLLEPMQAGALVYRGTMFRMASLALGALLAYDEVWVRRSSLRAIFTGTAALLIGSAVIALGRTTAMQHWYPVIRLAGYAAVSVGTVMIVISLNDCGRLFGWLLSNPPLRYVGRISYGLYLFHYPIYFVLGLHLPRDVYTQTLMVSVWAVALTFLVASASWFLIESPILRFKSLFTVTSARDRQPAISSGTPAGVTDAPQRRAA